MRIYTYDSPYLRANYAIYVIGVVGFTSMVYYGVHILHSHHMAVPFWAWLMMFALPVMFTGGLILTFFQIRPIGLSEDGISNYLFWRQRKFIDWRVVTKIERNRFYDTAYYRYRYSFRVWGNGICIRFDDWIGDLPGLLSVLNIYIAKHQIPAFTVDRGRDTLRKATSADEKRKVMREGVRTPVSEFSCSDNSVSTSPRRPWRF